MSNNSSNNNTTVSGGIGFSGLLTIVFIVLKLCGVINWSWIWVLAPMWVSAALCVAIILIVAIFSFIIMIFKK